MVTKRIRTEYMKKFKDPKWENYSKCYEELLKYRLTRRLLECTHNPWFWNGSSDSDSESGGSPIIPNENHVETVNAKDRNNDEYEECEGLRIDEQQKRPGISVPKIPLPEEQPSSPQVAVNGAQSEDAGETRVLEEERQEQRASSRDSKRLSPLQREMKPEPKQTKPTKSSKLPQRTSKVKPVSSLRKPKKDLVESRHPFALYGWGERDAEMASRKTHNVRPAASTKEIHESALRAKTRREVERQIQTQKVELRRAKSADVDKKRTNLTQPEFNPWLTEYMRCFSARSR